ncbi:MAG: DUF1553 domain-containing protein [Planctomycetaceae bacterium]|nr:DUF1553 domain-containing protein [Planctomycetaceae bacterium]
MNLRLLLSMMVVSLSCGFSVSAEESAPDFTRDILPIFDARCTYCHGEDEQKGGLSLHELGHLKRGGDRAVPVVPGKSEESLLYKALVEDGDLPRMPLEDDPLSAEEIDLIKRWIDAGAPGWKETPVAERIVKTDHWSFQPIVRPVPPRLDDPSLVENPIDRFIQHKLAQEGLSPAPAADRRTLIRRLSLDLLGLLPEPAEVEHFVNDTRPDAYERLVDRLLDSPHFGERWGRHWLDAARYADSNGYTIDGARSIWPYRDWVIEAFNRDLPFDRFIIEQLAGDLLPEPSREQLVATGFHRNTLINEEGGTDKEQFRVEAVVDRVSTTGTVLLGLTVGCAQCHTHKYDPITQREFYELFAVFNQCDEPYLDLPTDEQSTKKQELSAKVADAKQALKDYTSAPEQDAKVTESRKEIEAWLASSERFWKETELSKVSAQGSTQFEDLGDRSWLVLEPENHETYILEFEADVSILSGLRLEALTHERIPNKGPGYTPHGNFTLNNVRLEKADGTEIPLVRAVADHSQGGGEALNAIDDDPKSFWAINGDKAHTPKEIQFELGEDVTVTQGTKLRLILEQAYGSAPYVIGRFRVSQTSAPRDYLQIALLDRRQWEQDSEFNPKKHAEVWQKLQELDPERKRLEQAVKSAEAELKNLNARVARTMILRQRTELRTTHVHIRGDFLRKGIEVQPNVPAVLHDLPEGVDAPNRLEFARWLMSPENPLTARVTVNRFWQRLFGLGIVETENDFGIQGSLPSHPELLDWLAVEFIEQDWSVKAILKTIVMSHTYRQSSNLRPELQQQDPRNRLLARQSRVRLEAEIIRDVALDAAGLLSSKMGGPGVYPPQPEGIYVLTQVKKRWDTDTDEDRYRRGIYTYLWRSSPYPFLPTFDAPSPTMACTRRARSNTPLQALTLANDAAFVEMAKGLAQRILAEGPDYQEGRIRYAWEVCFSREPTEDELNRLSQFVSRQKEQLNNSEAATALANAIDVEEIDQTDKAAWLLTARVLMNLDEFITRE